MEDLVYQLIGQSLARRMAGSEVRVDGRIQRMNAVVATAFTARELEFVKTQTYDIKKVELCARKFIPVSNEAHPGTEIVSYDQYDTMGEAEVTDSYSEDAPEVDATKQNFQAKVFGLRASYKFTIQDLRAIAMSGSRLSLIKPMAARRAMEAKFDRIAAKGVARINKPGFVNHPAVNAAIGAVSYSMATPATTLYQYLNSIAASIVTRSNQIEKPNAILFPTKAFQIFAGIPFGSNGDRMVLESWLQTNPYGVRNADQWVELDGAGVGGTDRIVCYRYGNDVAEIEEPQPYEELDPQLSGMTITTHCHSRTGGVVVRYPGAMQYADGTFVVT
jgi:hypothetical protein